jgi:hypothetical protein
VSRGDETGRYHPVAQGGLFRAISRKIEKRQASFIPMVAWGYGQ